MAYEPISKSENTIGTFYGYNHNLRTGDGEFYDMQNLTSSYFPLLATRPKRATTLVSGCRTETGGKTNLGSGLHGIFGKNKFGYIKDEKLFYDGVEVEGLDFPDIEQERHIVSMGAYLLIFPDKKYLNTADLTDCGDMGATVTTETTAKSGWPTTLESPQITHDDDPSTPDIITYGGVDYEEIPSTPYIHYFMTDENGVTYKGVTYGETAPASPTHGNLWMDTKGDAPFTLKRYNGASGSWIPLTIYVKIVYPKIGAKFKKFDGVKISGSIHDEINTTVILQHVGTNYVVVKGFTSGYYYSSGAVTITREIPDMEHYCEGENRVWGCNSEKNEIYACKLGDFKNWNSFAGNSTDSYAVTVGTDGAFTGAIRYSSTVLFFKENCVHKIYNTNPPYQMSTTILNGVMKGSHRSLAIVNGVLYYLSPVGICSYEGSISSPAENVFGLNYYHSGVGGEYRGKYYISLSTSVPIMTGTVTIEILGIQMPIPVFGIESFRELYVYDTRRGLWHKESIQAAEFASYDNNLYFVEETITTVGETTTTERTLGMVCSDFAYGDFTAGIPTYDTEKHFNWYAETGLLGLDYAGHKYINAVSVRLKLTPTGVSEYPSFVKLYAEYDSSGKWELLDEIKAQETHGFTIKANIPRRCDHMRLKIEGRGECLIYSITLQTEGGSEL